MRTVRAAGGRGRQPRGGGNRGLIVVVSAPSGAGKTTLCKRLLRQDRRIEFSVSFTTRPRRPGERDGVDYRFVDRREFERRRRGGEFVEWASVGDHLYGTSVSAVQEASRDGRDVLLDLDTQGAASLRRLFPEAILIFILPPDRRSLGERLEKRATDTPSEVARRLALARGEVEKSPGYDYVIVNEDLDTAYRQLRGIVEAERCRTFRQKGRLAAILRGFVARN